MRPVSSCPDATRLHEHLRSALPPSDEHELASHLDTCVSCQHTLQGLVLGSGRLLQAAARVGAAPATRLVSPTLRQVLDRLTCEDGCQTRAGDATLWRAFLAPPNGPGELGRIDHYAITSILGQGGMGVVFKAVDEPLNRAVAIKMPAPTPALDTQARGRFAREARAAAAIVHPNVVTVHAVAEVNGLPYLVMEYVLGQALQQCIGRGGPLTVDQVVHIGKQVAAGLAAAHASGVVHRDITPSNILVKDNGEVKITDFGLARVVDEARLSRNGVVAGTPDYMAPEQARGEAVDHRVDLFSLGSVLYALCTGRAPFAADSALATLKRVCEETPAPIRGLNPEVPEWLAAIIGKLHAKDPAKRFQSAAEVAELLESRSAPSPVPRSLAAWSRWRWLAAAAVAACLLATSTAVLPQIIIRIRNPDGTVTESKTQKGAKVELEVGGKVVAAAPSAAEVLLGHSRVVRCVAFAPAGTHVLSASADGSVLVWDVKTGNAVQHFDGHRHAAYAVAVSPKGRQVLSGGGFGTEGPQARRAWSLCLWDIDSGKELRRGEGPEAAVTSLAWSADGKRALVGSYDGVIWLWDVENWKEIKRWQDRPGLWSVALSADGQRALSAGGYDNKPSLRVWDVKTGEELHALDGHSGGVWQAVFTPDGRQALSVGGGDNTIRVWNVDDGRLLSTRRYADSMVSVALAVDGEYAVSGGYDKLVRLWHMPTRTQVGCFEGHTSGVQSVAYSRDGRYAASGGHDNTVRLWPLPPMTKRTPAAMP